MGFNPFFHDSDLVEREMRANSQAMEMADSVDKVYFYGAGSSSPELCEVIAEGLATLKFMWVTIWMEPPTARTRGNRR